MSVSIDGTGSITGLSVGGLPDGSVDADSIAAGAVTDAKIGTGAVTNAKLGTGAVTDVKLGTGIDAAKLADGTVTSTELQYINSLSSNAQTQISGAGVTDIKFLACLTSDQSNVTGDGTAWLTSSTTAWTEKYNTGSGFSNGTFTAPETGKYLIFFQMYISGISGSHTENNFYINTSNRNYSIGHENFANIYVTANVSYNLGPYMVVADMDAGDTATGYLAAYNGSKTIDMEGNGNSNSTSTYFGGALLA